MTTLPWHSRRVTADNPTREYHIHKVMDSEPSLKVQAALERSAWVVTESVVYLCTDERTLQILNPFLRDIGRQIFHRIKVEKMTVFTCDRRCLYEVQEIPNEFATP